jgi:catechol 2,3-dioxygenase-like lactoylglutathione lyase family enzyme
MAEGNILQVTPFMHVTDLASAVLFFEDVLGFETLFRMNDYAYVERDGAGLRIQSHDNPAEMGVPHGGFAYYFDVRDVDTLFAELKPRLTALPEGDVHGPVDQEYGQRELLIRAPDGNLVVFGQAVTV